MTTTTLPQTIETCPTCNCPNHREVLRVNRHGEFRIELCAQCGLAFAAPRPTPDELARFYSATYFKKDSNVKVGYADYRGLAEANAKRMWRQLKHKPLLRAVPQRTLLDVGCATGGFLVGAVADGWQATGVELAAEAVAVARSEFSLNVIHGDINASRLHGSHFGLITMWHVLEHVIHPRQVLARARDLLLPGGILLIELPNWNSLGRLWRGNRWSALTPPEHINFFTPRSLRTAVAAAGFTSISVGTRYPSLIDKARVMRPSQPFHAMTAGAATVASALGFGGYVRLTARRPR